MLGGSGVIKHEDDSFTEETTGVIAAHLGFVGGNGRNWDVGSNEEAHGVDAQRVFGEVDGVLFVWPLVFKVRGKAPRQGGFPDTRQAKQVEDDGSVLVESVELSVDQVNQRRELLSSFRQSPFGWFGKCQGLFAGHQGLFRFQGNAQSFQQHGHGHAGNGARSSNKGLHFVFGH